MAAQAIFSAKATQFFETTKKMREELKSLAKEATKIPIGASDKAALDAARLRQANEKAVTAELNRQTAAIKKQEAEYQGIYNQSMRNFKARIDGEKRATKVAEEEAAKQEKALKEKAKTEEKLQKDREKYEKDFTKLVDEENKKQEKILEGKKKVSDDIQKQKDKYERDFTKLVDEENKKQAKSMEVMAKQKKAIDETIAKDALRANKEANAKMESDLRARNKALAHDIQERYNDEQKSIKATMRSRKEADDEASRANRQAAAAIKEKEAGIRAAARGEEAGITAAERSANAQRNVERAAKTANKTKSEDAKKSYQVAVAAAQRASQLEIKAAQAAASAVQAAQKGNATEARKYADVAIKASRDAARAQREAVQASRDVRLFDNESLKKQAEGFLGTLSKAKDRFLATMLAFATGYLVIQGLGKAFMAAKDAILDFNSLMEQTSITLTTLMGGNAAAADKFIGKLKEFARLTPFEFRDLVPLTQKMIALGLVSEKEVGKKVIPALRAVGNAVAALGAGPEGLERVIRALGQMATKGKLSAEELTTQLAEVGINGAKYIAQAMGMTQDKVFELMKKGAIDGKKAADAILYGIAHDPLYKNMMQAQSATFAGAMSNMKDAATMLVADGFKPLFESLSKWSQEMSKIIGTDSFQKWAKDLMANLIEAFTKIGAAFNWFFTQLSDKLPYLLTLLTMLGGAKIINSILMLRVTLVQAGNAAAAAWLKANLVLALTAAAVIAFVAAYRNFEEVRSVTEGVVGSVLVLLKGLNSAVYAMAIGVVQLFRGITMASGTLIGTLSAPLQKLQDFSDKVDDFFAGEKGVQRSPIQQKFKNFIDGIVDSLDFRGAEDTSTKFWDGILDGLEAGQKHAQKYWDSAISDFVITGNKKLEGFMMRGGSSLFNFNEMMAEARSEIAKTMKSVDDFSDLKLPDNLLRSGEDKGAAAKAKKLKADQLQDGIKFYDAIAKAAIDSAKRQMDAFTSVRDKFRELFGGAQESLLKEGIINNPLGGIISDFERWVGLEPRMKQLAISTAAVVNAARTRQKAYETAYDKFKGGDGQGMSSAGSYSSASVGSTAPVKTGSSGGEMPAYMATFYSNIGKVTSQITGAAYDCGKSISWALNKAGYGVRALAIAATNNVRADASGHYPMGTVLHLGKGGRGTTRHYGMAGRIRDDGQQEFVESTANVKNMTSGGYHIRNSRTVEQIAARIIGAGLPAGVSRTAPQTKDIAPMEVKDAKGFLPKKGQGSTASAFGQAGSEIDAMFENLDGSLAKLRAVPKAWGVAVRNVDSNATKFQAQSLLAQVEFQAYVQLLAKKSFDIVQSAKSAKGGVEKDKKAQDILKKMGLTANASLQDYFDAFVKKIRSTANMTDAMRNRLLANRLIATDIQGMQRDRGLNGRTDPMGVLAYEMKNGKYKDADSADKQTMKWEVQSKLIRDAEKSTRLFVQAEQDRLRVSDLAQKYNRADTASLRDMAKAYDTVAKRMEIIHSKEYQDLALGGQKGAADDLLNDKLKSYVTTRDTTEAHDFTGEVNRQIAALQDRANLLKIQSRLVQEGFNDAALTDWNEAATAAYETAIKFGASVSEAFKIVQALSGGNDIEEAAKSTDKWRKAQELFNSILGDKAINRQFDKSREYKRLIDETTKSLALAAYNQQVYFSGMGGPEAERSIALAGEQARLMAEASSKGYSQNDIKNRLGQFAQQYDANASTRAAGEYAGVAQEAAKSTAMWGDESGLAALRFEMAKGSLQSLTEEQQKQMLINQAQINGLQKFGEEYRGLTSQQLSLTKEIDEIGMAMNGHVKARQKQELEWKYQDLEMMAQIKTMTDAQRDAYLAQQPAVDALREKVLSLIDAQEEAQKFVENTQELMERFNSIFQSGLEGLYENGVRGFIDKVSEGISGLIDDISQQIISAMLTKLIFDMFPQISEWYNEAKGQMTQLSDETLRAAAAATKGALAYLAMAAAAKLASAVGAIAGSATGGAQGGGSGGGGDISTQAPPPTITAAIGVDRIPYDMARVIAHKDEAILTRDEANTWRGMKQGVIGAGSGKGGATQVTVTNNFHIENMQMNDVQDPQGFADNVQEETSRRTQKDETRKWLGG